MAFCFCALGLLLAPHVCLEFVCRGPPFSLGIYAGVPFVLGDFVLAVLFILGFLLGPLGCFGILAGVALFAFKHFLF